MDSFFSPKKQPYGQVHSPTWSSVGFSANHHPCGKLCGPLLSWCYSKSAHGLCCRERKHLDSNFNTWTIHVCKFARWTWSAWSDLFQLLTTALRFWPCLATKLGYFYISNLYAETSEGPQTVTIRLSLTLSVRSTVWQRVSLHNDWKA